MLVIKVLLKKLWCTHRETNSTYFVLILEMQHPYLVSAVIDGDLVALANPPHLGRWIGSVKIFHVKLFADNISLDLTITLGTLWSKTKSIDH